MPALCDRVSTVVLLMFENRSFDHMLGHLTLEALVPDVDGLAAPLSRYENLHGGRAFTPFRMTDRVLDSDLPHEWNEVDVQLARSEVTQRPTMKGFVEAYARFRRMSDPDALPEPMGYFPSDQVPVTSFLARTFMTCDRWHCPLPTSTQPNRAVAWTGVSEIFDSRVRLIGTDDTILDWLDRAEVRWRVYHDGLSWFALFPRAWDQLLGDRFRDFEAYLFDMQTEPLDEGPQVVIVEPSYQDAPHLGSDRPNDNHAPLAIGWGEEFLRRTYEAASVNPERWAKTVMVVYYDEHGGFHDHVPPPAVTYTTRGDEPHAFATAGPRVPAFIVSPLVPGGSVSHLQLDHTSVLQLLAELFTPGQDYSADVRARREQGVASLSAALQDAATPTAPPPPAQPIVAPTVLGRSLAVPPGAEMQAAFERAASELMDNEPKRTGQKYPELFHWKVAAKAARGR